MTRISKRAGTCACLALAFCAVLPIVACAAPAGETENILGHNFMVSPERIRVLNVERIVEMVVLRPGITVLDVGAGEGIFALPFARRLRGAGRVFAAEVDAGMVGRMAERARKEGLENLFPVLVDPVGTDPFYSEHEFDVVFVCSVFQNLASPREFFRELRGSLKKGGRLFILHDKTQNTLWEPMFGDFSKVLRRIQKYIDSPIALRLSGEARKFCLDWDGGEIGASMRRRIVSDLGGMLGDRSLFPEIKDYLLRVRARKAPGPGTMRIPVRPEDAQLMRWLYVRLDAANVFRGSHSLSRAYKDDLREFNRLYLINMLGLGRVGPDNPHIRNIAVEKSGVVRRLEDAGYRLVREHPPHTLYHILEFSTR